MATPVTPTLSLHDALPILLPPGEREVMLRTSDGINLAASWVPPRNGAAVVLVHGSGGDRGGAVPRRHPACSEVDSVARRSQEHTSELQSPVPLVCRLLLAK